MKIIIRNYCEINNIPLRFPVNTGSPGQIITEDPSNRRRFRAFIKSIPNQAFLPPSRRTERLFSTFGLVACNGAATELSEAMRYPDPPVFIALTHHFCRPVPLKLYILQGIPRFLKPG
jgi:hypothetical protein